MPWSLASLARSRTRRQTLVLRDIEIPAGLTADLAAIYRRVPRAWSDRVPRILEAYEGARAMVARDDAIDILTATLEQQGEEVTRLVLTLSPLVEEYTARVERWHKDRWLSVIRQAIGIDAGLLLSPEATSSPIRAALNRNIGLIANLSDDIKSKVTREVWDGVANATPRRQIGKQIAETMKIGRERADFIARDQALKISSSLDQARQTEAGIEEYRWRTVEDGRVRPSHKAHNGKIYKWSAAPADTGHPGHDINCRCKAQAYIDLMAELDL